MTKNHQLPPLKVSENEKNAIVKIFNESPFDNFSEWHRKKLLEDKREPFWDEKSPFVKIVKKMMDDGK